MKKTTFKPFALWPQTPEQRTALLEQLADIDIVSFDIFDTAVYRPFARPRDLFHWMELKTKTPNFYRNRVQAVRQTRQNFKEKGVQEVTLDEIYQTLEQLDHSLTSEKLADLKHIEQETEIALCRPNPDLLSFYQAVKQLGKKIVFTSDMYLPEQTIETILHKCGYLTYDQLIISQMDRLTKKSGRRFINFLNTKPDRILHIGDNPISDGVNAAKAGIHAILYTLPSNNLIAHRLIKQLKKSDDLFANFWRAQILHQPMPNYWYAVGFQYIGPLLVHFSNWLKQSLEQNGLRQIAFMARDGQIMRAVFDTLYPDFAQTNYVFASRAMMQAALNQSAETYVKYLTSLGLSATDFALIDVGRNGTLQKNMNTFFEQNKWPNKITGYYIDLRKNHPDMNGYYTKQPKKYRRFLDFLDFLLIADHPLITDIRQNGTVFEPVFLAPDADEQQRESIARHMHQGAVDFAKNTLPFADCSDFYEHPTNLLTALNTFLKFTQTDKSAFQRITVPFGLKNEKKRYVVPPYFGWKKWVKHPLDCYKIYKKSLVK